MKEVWRVFGDVGEVLERGERAMSDDGDVGNIGVHCMNVGACGRKQ